MVTEAEDGSVGSGGTMFMDGALIEVESGGSCCRYCAVSTPFAFFLISTIILIARPVAKNRPATIINRNHWGSGDQKVHGITFGGRVWFVPATLYMINVKGGSGFHPGFSSMYTSNDARFEVV